MPHRVVTLKFDNTEEPEQRFRDLAGQITTPSDTSNVEAPSPGIFRSLYPESTIPPSIGQRGGGSFSAPAPLRDPVNISPEPTRHDIPGIASLRNWQSLSSRAPSPENFIARKHALRAALMAIISSRKVNKPGPRSILDFTGRPPVPQPVDFGPDNQSTFLPRGPRELSSRDRV